MSGSITPGKPSLKHRIRDWWAASPMTYGEDQHGGTEYTTADGRRERVALGSRLFFERADERFYGWNAPLHTPEARFARIFDYPALAGRPVLEVGCGLGCMAMNWARHGARITAVDLNPVAVAQTRQRFEIFELPGEVREADAEALPFAAATFDYAYSWGVLHHTPNTATAIAELHRVLSPGGRVGVMLYHRHSLLYRYTVRFVEGFVNMESDFLDETGLASRYGDGGREEGNPHTWPVTVAEARRLFHRFDDVDVRVLGTDVPPILDTWLPGLGSRMPRAMREALARRWGWSLWITARKAGAER